MQLKAMRNGEFVVMLCPSLQQLATSYHDRRPSHLSLMGFNIYALEHGAKVDESKRRPECQLSTFAVDQLHLGKELFLGGKLLTDSASPQAWLGYEQERRDLRALGVV
jgi:hypothetical protein